MHVIWPESVGVKYSLHSEECFLLRLSYALSMILSESEIDWFEY